MKRLLILFFLSAFTFTVYSQTAPVEYEVRYNVTTGLYEGRLHVLSGNLTGTFAQIAASSFTIAVPASVPDTPIPFTSVGPPLNTWTQNENAFAPAANPSEDYRRFGTNGGGTFTSFTAGDDILLFTFDLGGCVDGVRVYINGTDPDSGAPGMSGQDFRNSLQTQSPNGGVEQYTGNRNEDFFFEQTSPGDWNDATTWLNNRIPTPYSNVRISHPGVSTISATDQDYVVDNLEIDPGSELVVENGRTLGITRDVTNNGDFTGDGIVELIGPCGPQDLIGTGSYNKLIADNVDGVNVTESTVIKGYLNVDDGNFTTNDATTFPCSFEEPTTGDFENARAGQIGPLGPNGTITGDVNVEQCYPGRRAFRFVSASTNTTTSIQDNWQENASAYDDFQVNNFPANGVQDDGIEFGYGTHITGIVPDPANNALGQQNLDQTNGLDWQPSGNASMFEFDNATQTTNAVLVTETGNTTETAVLEAGKPYYMMIRGSRQVNLENNASPTYNTKLRSTGEIIKGGTATSTNYTGVSSGDFILIGNPFHAIVDMVSVVNNSTGIGNMMYAYDPTLGGVSEDVNPDSQTLGGRGAYVTINLTDAIPGDGQAGEMNQYLQAYQGVFLQVTADNPTVVFSESDKAVDQPQLDVFSSPSDRIAITLYDQLSYSSNSTADDSAVILFDQNENNGVDFDDALKFTNPDENLARLENGSLLAYETRAMPQADEILELHTEQYRTTDYVFVVEVNGLNNNSVYLYDNYTDTETLLDNDISTAVTFSVDESTPESIASNRFEIRFQSSTLGTNDFDLQGLSVYPNPASDILNISFGENTGRFETLELFDISGRLVAKQAIGSQLQETQVDVNTFSSGVYLLKVSAGSEEFTTKVIVE